MLTKFLYPVLLLSGAACGQTISNGELVVPYSANLTFNVGYASAYVNLSGNVSAVNVPAGTFGGQSFHLTACQGSGGPYTVPASWSNTTGATTIWTTGCTRFHLVWDDPAAIWVSTIQGPANSVSAPLAIAGNNISIPVASGSSAGYLAAADWTSFNSKQSAATANANNAGIGNCSSGQYATGTSAGSAPPCAQVSAAQVSGLAASATTDTTNAGNIGSGTLAHARLPALLSGDIPNNAATTTGASGSLTGFTNPTAAGTARLAQIVAQGTLALATSSIASYGCQTVTAGSINSATATGTATTDSVAFIFNGSVKAVTGYAPSSTGGLIISPYPTAGYVNFDVCNWTSAAITPGAVSLNWEVVR